MKSHVMLVILAVVAGLVLTQAAASYGSPRGCSASTLLRISRAGTFAGAGVHHSLSDLVGDEMPMVNLNLARNELPSSSDVVKRLLPPAAAAGSSSNNINDKSGCVVVALMSGSPELVSDLTGVISNTRVHAKLLLVTTSSEVGEAAHRRNANFDVTVTVVDGEAGEVRERHAHQGRREGLSTIRVCYVRTSPYVIEESAGVLDGMDVETWRTVAGRMRAELSFKLVKTFNHLGIELVNGSCDVSIGQPTQGLERYALGIDFSRPMVRRAVHFATRIPGPQDQIYATTYPFGQTTWIAVGVSMMLTTVALFITNLSKDSRMPPFHVVSVAYVALINESLPHHYLKAHLTNRAAFIVLFVWILCACLISYAYKSILLASLTAVEYEKPFTMFQDLLDNDVLLVLAKGTILTPLLRDAASPSIRQVYQNTERRNGLYVGPTPQPMLNMVDKGTAALISTPIYIIGRRHELLLSKEGLPGTYSGYYYRLKHPHEKKFEFYLGALQDVGIIKGNLDHFLWKNAKPERDHARRTGQGDTGQSRKATVIPLSVRHVLPMAVVTCAGFAVGLAAFLAEWAMKAPPPVPRSLRRNRSKEEKKKKPLVIIVKN